jgi:hypothetical protein
MASILLTAPVVVVIIDKVLAPGSTPALSSDVA